MPQQLPARVLPGHLPEALRLMRLNLPDLRQLLPQLHFLHLRLLIRRRDVLVIWVRQDVPGLRRDEFKALQNVR